MDLRGACPRFISIKICRPRARSTNKSRQGSKVRSAGLGARNVAGSDLVLMCGEGCEHFDLLALRNLEVIEGPPDT